METTRLIVLVAMAAVVGGCSSNEAGTAAAPAPQGSASPAAAAQPAAQPVARTACAMLTAAEISGILGTEVAAQSDEGGGSTSCTYRPSARSMPAVDVKITWGDGQVAMMGSRMMRRIEPGINAELAGLGDDASVVGPQVWVRVGEDLVTLTFMGVEDNVATAKRIITLIRPRMGPSAQGGATTGSGADAAAGAGK